jgi:hypothetical protein
MSKFNGNRHIEKPERFCEFVVSVIPASFDDSMVAARPPT